MTGRGSRPPTRGRLRLLAGFSVVLGTVTLLLSSGRQGAGGGAQAQGDRPGEAGAGQDELEHGTPPSAEALRDGFEPRDANPRAIGIAMGIAVGTIAVAIVGLFLMLGALRRSDAAMPPLTVEQRAVIAPPGPPLQASPQYDLASLGRRESSLLSTYQWLSPAHETARIPIERAMALVVGRPLSGPPTQVRP